MSGLSLFHAPHVEHLYCKPDVTPLLCGTELYIPLKVSIKTAVDLFSLRSFSLLFVERESKTTFHPLLVVKGGNTTAIKASVATSLLLRSGCCLNRL